MKSTQLPFNLIAISNFLQAIEDGNLDEVVEEVAKKPKKPKKRKSEAGGGAGGSGMSTPSRKKMSLNSPPDIDDGGSEPKEKKRRGRPPLEKHQPNPPRLTRVMKKLYNIVVNYKDR